VYENVYVPLKLKAKKKTELLILFSSLSHNHQGNSSNSFNNQPLSALNLEYSLGINSSSLDCPSKCPSALLCLWCRFSLRRVRLASRSAIRRFLMFVILSDSVIIKIFRIKRKYSSTGLFITNFRLRFC